MTSESGVEHDVKFEPGPPAHKIDLGAANERIDGLVAQVAELIKERDEEKRQKLVLASTSADLLVTVWEQRAQYAKLRAKGLRRLAAEAHREARDAGAEPKPVDFLKWIIDQLGLEADKAPTNGQDA